MTVRITEVEAYRGNGEDPGSHAHRGVTPRNARHVRRARPPLRLLHLRHAHLRQHRVLARRARRRPLLLRGGEVVDGVELARVRRPAAPRTATWRAARRAWRALWASGSTRTEPICSPSRSPSTAPDARRVAVDAAVRASASRAPAGERRTRGASGSRATRRCRCTDGTRDRTTDGRRVGRGRTSLSQGEAHDRAAQARPEQAGQRADDEPLARLGGGEFREAADALDRDDDRERLGESGDDRRDGREALEHADRRAAAQHLVLPSVAPSDRGCAGARSDAAVRAVGARCPSSRGCRASTAAGPPPNTARAMPRRATTTPMTSGTARAGRDARPGRAPTSERALRRSPGHAAGPGAGRRCTSEGRAGAEHEHEEQPDDDGDGDHSAGVAFRCRVGWRMPRHRVRPGDAARAPGRASSSTLQQRGT